MIIRRAQNNDIEGIGKLLLQVHRVHSSGRPDIFRVGSRKYNDSELELIIKNDKISAISCRSFNS